MEFSEDVLRRMQQARELGWEEDKILAHAKAEQRKQDREARGIPEGGTGKYGWIPVAGGIAGSLIGGGTTLGLGGVGAIAGGSAGSALGELVRQRLAGEEANLGMVGQEAALGLAGGVAGEALGAGVRLLRPGVGRMLGRGVTEGAEAIGKEAVEAVGKEAVEETAKKAATKRASQAVQRSIVQPKLPVNPFLAEAEETLVRQMDEIADITGVSINRGSARNRLQLLPKAMKRLTKMSDDIFAKSNPNIAKANIKEQIEQAGIANINFNQYSKAQAQHLDDVLNQLFAKSKYKGVIDTKTINDFKLGLGKTLGKAFRKKSGDLATKLTHQEAASLHVWEQLDNIIGTVNTPVKNVTSLQSVLHTASAGLQKSTKSGIGLPLIGKTEIVTRAQQKVGDIFSQGLDATPALGRITKPLPEGALRRGAGQVASRSMFPKEMEIDSPPTTKEGGLGETPMLTEENISGDGLWKLSGGNWIPTQDHIKLMAIKDFQETGGKNLSRLSALAKFLTPAEEQLDANTVKQLQKLSAAEGTLDVLENSFTRAGGAGGRIGGSLKSLAGALGLDPETKSYNDLRKGVKAQFARAFGEVGNLTAQEQKDALELIPSITDTQREAELKLQDLRRVFQQSRARLKAEAGGGVVTTELGEEPSLFAF